MSNIVVKHLGMFGSDYEFLVVWPNGKEEKYLVNPYLGSKWKFMLSKSPGKVANFLKKHGRKLSESTMEPSDVVAKFIDNPVVLVFVFETLMNQELRAKLLGRDVEFSVDSIPNYKEITTNTDGGDNYNTIVPFPGGVVNGHVLFLTPAEMSILDDWEDQYEKKQVRLSSGLKAWVYILNPEFARDYGTNTSYDLSQDDIDIISKEF